MILGAHVGIAGGLATAVCEAIKLKIKAIQIFSSSPRSWVGPERSREEIDAFLKSSGRIGLESIFVHAKYLVNLGSPDPAIIANSIRSLKYDLLFAGLIHAAGVIFHIGSFKNTQRETSLDGLVRHCRQVLDDIPADVSLILENSAGAGRTIGSKLEEIGWLVKQVQSVRLKFCFDTCHAFASGYDLRTAAGAGKVIKEVDRQVGLARLVCFHINDSQQPLGSNRDRHANLGEGYIGRPGLRRLIQSPRLGNLPFIIETPNLKIGRGDKDLDWLRNLA